MDNFKAVYTILTALEKCMDLPHANIEMFNAEALGVSEERWKKYIEMMLDCGYIKGVTINTYIDRTTVFNCNDIQITLKGLEYLQENSMMQKVYKTVKGIKDIVPGM
nr:MAG TPA: YjcQ protein [Caudoviricetes sp.]